MTTTAEPFRSTAPPNAVSPGTRAEKHSEREPPRRVGHRRLSTVVVALVALSPFVVGAFAIVQRGFPPGALFGDRAILGLTAIDAWRAPMLLGPYSRFYWHHPGPLYFYVLNVLSTLLGGGTVGLVLGATAINAAAAAGVLVLAVRRGGHALLLWASLLLTTYFVVIEPTPFDIWNPSVTLFPFILVLLLAWSVACRDWWAAPVLVLVASFVVQTHVGLAPGVAMACAFTIVVALVRRRRSGTSLQADELRTIRRSGLVTLVVAFVVWLPPALEELTSREGNLSLLVRFFTRPGSPHAFSEGLTNTALQATLMVRGLFAPITLRYDGHQALGVTVVVSAVALAAAVVVARRIRAIDTLPLLMLVVVQLSVAVYAVTRIAGPIQFYLVQWISAVGFVLWLAVGSAAIEFVRTRLASGPRWPTIARCAAFVVIVLLCVSTIRAFPGNAGLVNEDLDVPNNRELFGYVPTAQLLDVTRRGQTVVLRNDEVTAWEVLAADALMLEQHGRRVQIVEAAETRLLFDDALLIRRAPQDAQILSFRDRAHPKLGLGETVVADQGKWSIVTIDPN